MRVPGAERAFIAPEKLRDRILSRNHPVGRFKAAVFGELGYSAEEWPRFEGDLRHHVLTHEVVETIESPYGRKFVVEGPLIGPAGKAMQVVSVWVIIGGEDIPRFVTAYPEREK